MLIIQKDSEFDIDLINNKWNRPENIENTGENKWKKSVSSWKWPIKDHFKF